MKRLMPLFAAGLFISFFNHFSIPFISLEFYCKPDCLSSVANLRALESFAYIIIQTTAKTVSTIGCAAITPLNCQKLFNRMTAGIKSITFLIIVINKNFTAAPNA